MRPIGSISKELGRIAFHGEFTRGKVDDWKEEGYKVAEPNVRRKWAKNVPKTAFDLITK